MVAAPEARDLLVLLAPLVVAVGMSLPAARCLLPEAGAGTLLLALVAVTGYLCVPETDHYDTVVVAFAVAAVLEVGARAVRLRHVPLVVHLALAAVILWASADGVTGRDPAVVGVAVAWWPVLLAGLLVWRRPVVTTSTRVQRLALIGPAVVAALAVARTGALADEVMPALVSAGLAMALSGGWALLVSSRARPRGRSAGGTTTARRP